MKQKGIGGTKSSRSSINTLISTQTRKKMDYEKKEKSETRFRN